jgi:hypothetical protein
MLLLLSQDKHVGASHSGIPIVHARGTNHVLVPARSETKPERQSGSSHHLLVRRQDVLLSGHSLDKCESK